MIGNKNQTLRIHKSTKVKTPVLNLILNVCMECFPQAYPVQSLLLFSLWNHIVAKTSLNSDYKGAVGNLWSTLCIRKGLQKARSALNEISKPVTFWAGDVELNTKISPLQYMALAKSVIIIYIFSSDAHGIFSDVLWIIKQYFASNWR